jgi:8-oxo-dGTP pyrophosphatase MutT (NUDIX family)
VIDRLKLALAQREKSSVTNTEIPAAVLIPIFLKNGEYHLLFTKRTDTVKTHKGEICFPGGHFEPEDITMLATALREANEEVGIRPSDVQIIGDLGGSVVSVFGVAITSYIGVIPYPHKLILEEREIAATLEVPVSFLLDPANLKNEVWERNGKPFPVELFHFHEHVIWGATFRILKIFLPVWAEAASENSK